MDTQGEARYRFGLFEADEATGELRRRGVRIRLQSQPFHVLLLLLRRPGEVLSREAIARELWPDGIFVDFDHGVNSAVNRIREALGDRASNPRFVETLARRGYRFVAPVERVLPSALAQEAINAPAPVSQGNPEAKSVSVADDHTLPSSSRPARFHLALSTPADLPKSPLVVVQTLFLCLQAMYLTFYVCTLAHWMEIYDLLNAAYGSTAPLFATVILTAALLIPVRLFLICAALFRPPAFQARFSRLWPFLLLADVLWSLAPFLLLPHISFGLALAADAVLVYSPFAQRALVLMGAGQRGEEPQ